MVVSNRWATWIGYGLSGLVIAFMLFRPGIKLVPLDVVITATAELGYPASVGLARGLGMLGLVCTALYAYPRTSVLGAILLTGYLGGTVATHLRAGSPIFSHMLFGVYLDR